MITLHQPELSRRQITLHGFQQLIKLSRPGDTILLEGLLELNHHVIVPHDMVVVINDTPLTGQFRLKQGDVLRPQTPIRPQVIEGVVVRRS